MADAAAQAILKLAEIAINDPSGPLHGPKTTGFTTKDSYLVSKSDPSKSVSFADLVALNVSKTVGVTGPAAAVANAIYNATGKRVRNYPTTPDKIMQA